MSPSQNPKATGSASKKARASEVEILTLDLLVFIAFLGTKAIEKSMTLHHVDSMQGRFGDLVNRLHALKEQNS